jgi:hypothetical protein
MNVQVSAMDLRPGDTIVGVGRINTLTLTSREVHILFDPVAAPPGTRLAPDHPVWIQRGSQW